MEIVARATITFFMVFLITRGLRRRVLSDLSPFEMIMLVTVGDIIQQGITQEDYSLTGATLAIGTFALWISVLSWSTWRSEPMRRIIEGVPVVLVRDGEPIDVALDLEQMRVEEVMEAARQNGIDDIRKIAVAVLEVNGRISIIPAEGAG